MPDFTIVPDVSRGLKNLETELRNRHDQIEALRAIATLGGVAAARDKVFAELERVQTDLIERKEALARLEGEVRQESARLQAMRGEIENETPALERVKQRAAAAADRLLNEARERARAEAERIGKEAQTAVEGALARAKNEAARIEADALAAKERHERDVADLQARIQALGQEEAAAQSRLANINNLIEKAKAGLAGL